MTPAGLGYAIKDDLADYGGRNALEKINPKFISGVKAEKDREIADQIAVSSNRVELLTTKQLDKTRALSMEYNGQGKQLRSEILTTKQPDKTKALSMEYNSVEKQLRSEILTTKQPDKTKAFSTEYNSLGRQTESEKPV